MEYDQIQHHLFLISTNLLKHSLSLRERARVRGQSLISSRCCPLNRPSATFSLKGEGTNTIHAAPLSYPTFARHILTCSTTSPAFW